jgi:phosphatidylserine decarboxylase
MGMILLVAFILSAIITLLLLLWRFYFLRYPTPTIPTQPKTVVAPASGKIMKIIHFSKSERQTIDKGLFGKIHVVTKDVAKEGYIIIIRLHVYNVHYQRAPIAGTVEKISYTYGKFFNAVKNPESLKCLFQNERNEIVITGNITCKVIQIAGFLARRIECFVEEKQKIEKGQELGVINLGSQVAFVLPKCLLAVKEGDAITVGETIIAETKK